MSKTHRVYLFVPGSSPAMLRTAAILPVDAIILDLEDAVAVTEKENSRFLVKHACAALPFGQKTVTVRINPLNTPWGEADLAMVIRVPIVSTIVLPKANPEAVRELDQALEGTDKKIIGIIETPFGLQQAYATATASPRISGLMLGAEDLTAEMGLTRTPSGEEIAYARSTIALACCAAGVQPIDTPFIIIDDLEGLRRDTIRAKKAGFTGKAAISPLHIEVIQPLFTPEKAEIEEAKQLLQAAREAAEKGLGAVQFKGKMIDKPLIRKAHRVLEAAGESENNVS